MTWVGVAGFEHAASSSRSQVLGQAARPIARLTSGVVSTVVHQCPWLVMVEVTHLVTRHRPDQPVADRGEAERRRPDSAAGGTWWFPTVGALIWIRAQSSDHTAPTRSHGRRRHG